MSSDLEKCANCGRFIGKLETPHLINEKIVCTQCKSLLSPQSSESNKHPLLWLFACACVICVIVATAFVIHAHETLDKTEAQKIVEKLAKDLEQKDKAYWSNAIAKDGGEATIFYIPGEIDIEKSNSVDHPVVAVATIHESRGLMYKAINSYTDESWLLTATLAKDNGRWICIKAERRLESARSLPESLSNAQPGIVNDDTSEISNSLRSLN